MSTIAFSNFERLVSLSKKGEAREHFKAHDKFMVGGTEVEIVGIGHDVDAATGERNTVTLRVNVTLGESAFNNKSCPDGYLNSKLREYVENVAYEKLPKELLKYVRPVNKQFSDYTGRLYEEVCAIFPFSETELFGSAIYSPVEEGKRYEAFATSKDRRMFDESGCYDWYWTRSPNTGNSYRFCDVTASGAASYYIASYSYGVACGLVI